jgi:hypothetical protein
MTHFEELIPVLTRQFDLDVARAEDLLDYILKKEKLFTFTTRKFGNSKIEKYLSLALKTISVEALSWIILSIKKDRMQPSQSLIHSRIKEFFDIKIGQKEWKKFIEHLGPNLVGKMNRYCQEIQEIKVNKVNEELVLFYFKDQGQWKYMDFSVVKDTDEDYKIFLDYIDDFFSETNSDWGVQETNDPVTKTKTQESHKKSKRFSESKKGYKEITIRPKLLSQPDMQRREPRNKMDNFEDNIYSQYHQNSKESQSHNEQQRDQSQNSSKSKPEIKIWMRSVERPLDRSRSGSSQTELNAEKQLISRGHSRAIPGGKYGCALMIKRCGPEMLKKKSLGRILALIKKSLEQGILNHYKTLLVKNKNKSNVDSTVRQQKIYEYSRDVIELLKENKEGISLAQFKQYYSRKFAGKEMDLDDLQFSKLTDFLNTMSQFVVIEKRDKNNNVALLVKDVNTRKALMHYNHLMKSLGSQKKLKSGPREEYGHTKEIIQRRRMDNRTLMGHETNIYTPKTQEHKLHKIASKSFECPQSKLYLGNVLFW